MFKRSLLSSAVAGAIALIGQQAIAQGATTDKANESTELEEIIVIGPRASLNQALDNKRFNTQIVDSIVSEDIGKFPDNNVVEALQRVSGVQVTGRGGGEITTVSIRGLTDVHTTVNGRDVFTGTGRAVALQDIPASLLSAVDVYKTRSASQVERGIAGSIDIKTHRPFDMEGMKVVLSVKGNYSDQSEKIDPNVSALLSNRWETGVGEFGALVNISYVETHYRDDDIVAGAAFPYFTANPPTGHQPYKIMNFGAANNYWQPGLTNGLSTEAGSTLAVGDQDIEYLLARDAMFGRVWEAKRERPAYNVSLQWAPSEKLELLGEVFYTGYRQEQQTSMWFTNTFEEEGNSGNLLIDTPTVYEGTNVIKSRDVYAPNGFQSGDALKGKTDSYLYALGATWRPSDSITVDTELLHQTSEFHDDFFAQRFDRKAYGLTADFNADDGTPALSFWDDPSTTINEADMADPANWMAGTIYDNSSSQKGDSTTLTVDTTWNPAYEYFDFVKFGVKAEKRGAQNFLREQGGAPSSMTALDFAQALIDAGASGDTSDYFYHVDDYMHGRADVFDRYVTASGLYLVDNGDVVRSVIGYEREAEARTFDIQETSYAAYVTSKYVVGHINGEVGVRYVDYTQDMDFGDSTGKGSATKVLPSLSLNWNITDDLVGRIAYTQTLRMPEFNDLNSTQFFYDPLTEGVSYGTGNGGNPDLKPVESTNYDMSLEWYFTEGSSLYGAVFKRELEGIVISGSKIVRRVGDDDIERDYILRAPVNASDGELSGVELGLVYFPNNLPDVLDGLGVQASYTMLDSSQTTKDFNDDGSVAATVESKMAGVSDSSYSVQALYDKDSYDVRLTYTWRDEFYTGDEAALFANPIQFWSRPEQSLDFQLNVDITNDLVINAYARNILDDKYQNYYGKGNENLFNFGTAVYSREFGAGIRYSF